MLAQPRRSSSFLRRLIIGELRQGALAGVMHEALARALDVPTTDVRRASCCAVTSTRLPRRRARRPSGLNQFQLQVGQPVLPMLRNPPPASPQRWSAFRPAAMDWKLDGARVQIHVIGDDVRVFTRSLDDITSRVPEVVEMARRLAVQSVVLDGEVLALKADGRPHPFQVSASRFGSRLDVERLRATLPLTPFVFDILHLNGRT